MNNIEHTNIVRRTDDVGRLTYPRELRSRLGIKEGDAFELCITVIEGQEVVCAIPYKSNLTEQATNDIAEALKNSMPQDAVIVVCPELYQTKIYPPTYFNYLTVNKLDCYIRRRILNTRPTTAPYISLFQVSHNKTYHIIALSLEDKCNQQTLFAVISEKKLTDEHHNSFNTIMKLARESIK